MKGPLNFVFCSGEETNTATTVKLDTMTTIKVLEMDGSTNLPGNVNNILYQFFSKVFFFLNFRRKCLLLLVNEQSLIKSHSDWC